MFLTGHDTGKPILDYFLCLSPPPPKPQKRKKAVSGRQKRIGLLPETTKKPVAITTGSWILFCFDYILNFLRRFAKVFWLYTTWGAVSGLFWIYTICFSAVKSCSDYILFDGAADGMISIYTTCPSPLWKTVLIMCRTGDSLNSLFCICAKHLSGILDCCFEHILNRWFAVLGVSTPLFCLYTIWPLFSTYTIWASAPIDHSEQQTRQTPRPCSAQPPLP